MHICSHPGYQNRGRRSIHSCTCSIIITHTRTHTYTHVHTNVHTVGKTSHSGKLLFLHLTPHHTTPHNTHPSCWRTGRAFPWGCPVSGRSPQPRPLSGGTLPGVWRPASRYGTLCRWRSTWQGWTPAIKLSKAKHNNYTKSLGEFLESTLACAELTQRHKFLSLLRLYFLWLWLVTSMKAILINASLFPAPNDNENICKLQIVVIVYVCTSHRSHAPRARVVRHSHWDTCIYIVLNRAEVL